MTSEPTKAIKAAAAGRPTGSATAGSRTCNTPRDVAATFLRALTRPFEGADAFNIRGTVVPIETFVATLAAVAPDAALVWSPTATASCPSPPTSTTTASTPASAPSPAPRFATASPRLTNGSSSCANRAARLVGLDVNQH